MVLIDGDPVHNISDIRHVVWVMKDGRLYSAPDLQEAIGVQPDRR
jgi:imidazolonepropionase-like amidohydrolase